jgi:pyridoxal phosphate enzyme (YggS family)
MKNLVSRQFLQIKQKIRDAECRFGRIPHSVQLIAISKSHDFSEIKSAIAAGQRAFGESYTQEVLEKIQYLNDLELEWHFIGRIQGNKAKFIATNFSLVHSLSELKVAIKLNGYRQEANLMPLNVCLQVNLQKKISKAGIYLEHLISLAKSIDKLSHLHLRGLMAIPKPEKDFAAQRENFKILRLSLEKLQTSGLQLDTLSMGMSEDFEAAIAEGATFVRIGTAISSESLFSRKILAILSPKLVRITRLKVGPDSFCVRHALAHSRLRAVASTMTLRRDAFPASPVNARLSWALRLALLLQCSPVSSLEEEQIYDPLYLKIIFYILL